MAEGKSFFIDTTKCTACRGCQMACKQWNQRSTEKTINRGNHQNPPDLSYNTWKLVRFSEIPGEKVNWYFFPEQCRHCMSPPCKDVADGKVKDAMLANPDDVRVIYLLADDPQKYHKFAVAGNTIGITRKMALNRLFKPLKQLYQMIG